MRDVGPISAVGLVFLEAIVICLRKITLDGLVSYIWIQLKEIASESRRPGVILAALPIRALVAVVACLHRRHSPQ
jgi:hypothetical protein